MWMLHFFSWLLHSMHLMRACDFFVRTVIGDKRNDLMIFILCCFLAKADENIDVDFSHQNYSE